MGLKYRRMRIAAPVAAAGEEGEAPRGASAEELRSMSVGADP